jgi:hypothetical protein
MLHFLEDRGLMSGAYDCPGYDKSFDVGGPSYAPCDCARPIHPKVDADSRSQR